MDQETIQKAVEAVQKVMKPIIEAVTRCWNALKSWVLEQPFLAGLLRTEMAKCNRSGMRSMFQPLPAVKAYSSQITYRPIRQVARSRC